MRLLFFLLALLLRSSLRLGGASLLLQTKFRQAKKNSPAPRRPPRFVLQGEAVAAACSLHVFPHPERTVLPLQPPTVRGAAQPLSGCLGYQVCPSPIMCAAQSGCGFKNLKRLLCQPRYVCVGLQVPPPPPPPRGRFLISLSKNRFYNCIMSAVANFKSVVLMPSKHGVTESSKSNLLGVSKDVVYNGFLSKATKRRICKLVSNFGSALYYSQKEGQCFINEIVPYDAPNMPSSVVSNPPNIINNTTRNSTVNSERTIIANAINEFHRSKCKGSGLRKIVFLTLTLPCMQKHTDNEIKRECLNRFLIDLCKYCDVKVWMWVAELQKNGNIHFHLLIDNYIPFVTISEKEDILHANSRAKCIVYGKRCNLSGIKVVNYAQLLWNKHLNRLGYIDDFEKVYKHRQPPTTQVELVKNENYMRSYLTKYITKEQKANITGDRVIAGRLWGCSDSLKLFENVTLPTPLIKEVLPLVKDNATYKYTDGFISYFAVNVEHIDVLFHFVLCSYSRLLSNVYDSGKKNDSSA